MQTNGFNSTSQPIGFGLVQLSGATVELVPLSLEHHDELASAVSDGELWNLWYTNAPEPENMRKEIERRLALRENGAMIPFAALSQGRAVGMTTYMNIDKVNRRVEIGSTWYARGVQRTALNTEAKMLLLTHAFEVWNCIAVEFRVHFLNDQSRRAVERLGAKFDGILRNHSYARNGTLRDTCVYSILPSEWPAVKAHLRWLLAKPR
jgi:RimJ/RimL family protein N-acetyltransferase